MTAQWTVMIYMAGDNNLSNAAQHDLDEIRAAGSSAEVCVAVEVDRAGIEGTKRVLLAGRGTERTTDLGETDSGSPETLRDFVHWAVHEQPAQKYALVLWNHGGGWAPAEIERLAQENATAGFGVAEARERSASRAGRALFRSSIGRILRIADRRERAICSDDGTGHSLDALELARVLASVRDELGRPLDLVGMDACLMASLEVVYELRDAASCVVASEESEPPSGWPYDLVLGHLVASPALTAAELATFIVESYVKRSVDSGISAPVTLSAVDTGLLPALLDPLDQLADAAIAGGAEAVNHLWGAQRRAHRFLHDSACDLRHLCRELRGLADAGAVGTAAVSLDDVFDHRPGPIVAEAHAGQKVRDCGGLAVYLPALLDVSPYYRDLSFARDRRWLGLVEAYRAELVRRAREAS